MVLGLILPGRQWRATNRHRRVPADLRAASLAVVPPLTCFEVMTLPLFRRPDSIDRHRPNDQDTGCSYLCCCPRMNNWPPLAEDVPRLSEGQARRLARDNSTHSYY
ncbi:hypothetical protein PoB_001639400 [Plakobranchus ocellatus]|uniref:Uncharacterized protein n=1 Tax=Plakobranchus ocellatus TaxID=259542 RepID=A0AAV3Z7A9_9GAST|nr:hypothetical protein PoB_001639400 [Plakobranchus ocellatus]